MNSISIFGTSSDSGKSTLTFVIAKILQEHGYSVVPFKAQNVSNNSKVCEDGSEIGIAQYFQAQVINVKPTYHMNPVLLKIEGNGRSQIVVDGKVLKTTTPRQYYKEIDALKPIVKKNFEYLQSKYDIIVAEGAGSPVELNLMDKDLANTYVASTFNTKIILVADIEKGGVFASIYGTYALLSEQLKKNVIGVVINKFRGDLTLFEEGINIIQDRFNLPVLGVVPYIPFNLGFEDSASLMNYSQVKANPKLHVAVIKFPKMSNYNDIEPLIANDEVYVDFISGAANLEVYDLVILPGTKSTIADLKWLKKTGLFEALKKRTKAIYGICGGYQMMFNNIIDDKNIENEQHEKESGLGFIEDEIYFQEQKILKNSSYDLFGLLLDGFEIHNGVSKKHQLFYEKDHIKGAFIHGIFDNDNFTNEYFKSLNHNYVDFNFQEYKKNKIKTFVDTIKESLDVKRILDSVS
ncbi:cobyric acid synthase CobQ [Arcobacter sp. 31_11_sub10_T18]|nr:cobyric acid synthase CobQ [Arcobacter sp. 31_11_sub10_T18]